MIKPMLTSLGCPKVLGKTHAHTDTHTDTLSDCSSTEVENY